MEVTKKFELEKIAAYLKLIKTRIVRETVMPDLLEVRDPSVEHFDCPDDSGEWCDITTGEHWGHKNGWADFQAKVTAPATWKYGYRLLPCGLTSNPELIIKSLFSEKEGNYDLPCF